jgi:metallophosphoesterase (TIGR03768 family)
MRVVWIALEKEGLSKNMKLFYGNKKLYFCVSFAISIFYSFGCSASVHREYPISNHVHTSLTKTIVPYPVPSGAPTILPYELSKYQESGYGGWHYGPGIPFEKRLDIMPSTYSDKSVTRVAELLNFFVISDVHIRDKESPAQLIQFGLENAMPSAYSGTMLYTTQFFDATVRTINKLHEKRPFDFGVSLGDSCNATQYNELRWFIDVLDGKVIHPSSGAHAGARTIDYQKPFKAQGLNKNIRWYQALGNHDHFWFGVLYPTRNLQQALIGKKIVSTAKLFPGTLKEDDFYLGSIDGSTHYGTVIGAGPVGNFKIPPKVDAADPHRRSLSRNEWIKEFFRTTSHPRGHGFKKSQIKSGFACYSFKPKSDVPIKVIVLDDTERDIEAQAPDFVTDVRGYLSEDRYNWLIQELDKGQSKGQLMIIAAHIPIGIDTPGFSWWTDPVAEQKLLDKLHTYPNLILWVAGHRHINAVTKLPSPDSSHPELGFWEVETCSLLQFPQQFRTFRIVRNSDNTISIFATDVPPAVKKGSIADKSRKYAIGLQQIANEGPPLSSYNAELVKQLTPIMQAKIKKCGKPISSK